MYVYIGLPSGSMVKNLLEVKETQVGSLSHKDPLEKEMLIHSSILTWEIPWTEEPRGLWSMGLQKSWTLLSRHARNLKTLQPICVSIQ